MKKVCQVTVVHKEKVNGIKNKLDQKDFSNLLVLGKCFSDFSRIKIFYALDEYCKCIEPPVRRNEPLNARNRASYCEQESRPTIFTYRTNLLYNEVACLRA